MDASLKATCDWIRTGGSEFSKVIQTNLAEEDFFIKPELDEILSEDKAILLKRPQGFSKTCEISVSIFPRYKFSALSIVCTAPKIEIFLAKQYNETVYGTIITDEESSVENNETEQIVQSYRYDVEIEKSGVVDLTLKLISQADEICIYGIILQIGPNPNGITTLTPQSINMDNVEQLLKNSNQKLSPNAEKCKLFLDTFCKNQAKLNKSCENPASILEHMKRTLGNPTFGNPTMESNNDNKTDNVIAIATLDKMLKSHIDIQLEQLEARINTRLDLFEQQQNEKLNKILALLSTPK